MPKFITVTTSDSPHKKTRFNIDRIIYYLQTPDGGTALIYGDSDEGSLFVKESVQTIDSLINEALKDL